MFYRIPEGSKVAMVKLVERLRRRNFLLFDAQMMNPHLERFGACTVEEPQYQVLLFLLRQAMFKSVAYQLSATISSCFAKQAADVLFNVADAGF
jgi:Leu/Phe-tRNA-protein transferase